MHIFKMHIQRAGEMAHQFRVRTSTWKFCGYRIKSEILSKEDETIIAHRMQV